MGKCKAFQVVGIGQQQITGAKGEKSQNVVHALCIT